MDNSLMLALADKVIPGYGFFGRHDPFALKVEVGCLVDRIDVFIDAGSPEILNISQIDFHAPDGTVYTRKDIIDSTTMSSIFHDTPQAESFERFLAGDPIHSKRERRPTLTIRLRKETQIGWLVVRNRNDKWARRSRYIVVRAENNGVPKVAYENCSAAGKVASLTDLLGKLGCVPNLGTMDDVTAEAEGIRGLLLSKLERKQKAFSVADLCQTLPLFSENPPVGDFEIRICAEVILKVLRKSSAVPSKFLHPFVHILRTGAIIKSVEVEASRILSERRGRPTGIFVSKHSVQCAKLVERREEFLDALDEIFSVLKEMGQIAMVCYGTLLGAVRNQQFIAFDDDVDLLLYSLSNSQEEALVHRDGIIERLSELGYNAFGISDTNFHINVNGCGLDFFVCWHLEDKIMLAMERLKSRAIDKSVIYPPSTVTLCGRKYDAVAKPEEFLQERYGASWRTPNQFHEWPWKLESVDVEDAD